MPDNTLQGLTTIFWGTKGVLTDTALDTEAIAESINVTPKVDAPEVEDGDGFSIARSIIDNGFDAVVKTVMNTAITYPVVGDVVKLDLPHVAGPHTGAFECALIDITPELARKKEGMVTMNLRYRPGIDLTP